MVASEWLGLERRGSDGCPEVEPSKPHGLLHMWTNAYPGAEMRESARSTSGTELDDDTFGAFVPVDGGTGRTCRAVEADEAANTDTDRESLGGTAGRLFSAFSTIARVESICLENLTFSGLLICFMREAG